MGRGAQGHLLGFTVFDEDFLQVHLGSIQDTVDGPRHSEAKGLRRKCGRENRAWGGGSRGQEEGSSGVGTKVSGEIFK